MQWWKCSTATTTKATDNSLMFPFFVFCRSCQGHRLNLLLLQAVLCLWVRVQNRHRKWQMSLSWRTFGNKMIVQWNLWWKTNPLFRAHFLKLSPLWCWWLIPRRQGFWRRSMFHSCMLVAGCRRTQFFMCKPLGHSKVWADEDWEAACSFCLLRLLFAASSFSAMKLISASCLLVWGPPVAMADGWFPALKAVSSAGLCNASVEHHDHVLELTEEDCYMGMNPSPRTTLLVRPLSLHFQAEDLSLTWPSRNTDLVSFFILIWGIIITSPYPLPQ